ncbi:hypothetical protein [Vibrio gangliei]|uniref:hypothetical protein n=1 Tax=Vibrio gangliei TaxID=2077090 RepID=UPI0013002252|nr:hypothetical protein [Vibrio gangliei]
MSIFNYLEGVSSAVKNDLSQYFSVNERITNNIETLLPEISVQANHNAGFALEKNEQIGIEGVNIMPDHYSFYSGSFIA